MPFQVIKSPPNLEHAIRGGSVTLSVFNIENDPPAANQLWNYSQGLGGFTAIFAEKLQDTAKTRLFRFGMFLAP
jgi:hypothetical protein